MRASDLLGREVVDSEGRRVGFCFDVRALVEKGSEPRRPALQIGALLVSPRRVGALLGYERGRTGGPWMLAGAVRLLHRGSALILLRDVDTHPDEGAITLKPGARKYTFD